MPLAESWTPWPWRPRGPAVCWSGPPTHWPWCHMGPGACLASLPPLHWSLIWTHPYCSGRGRHPPLCTDHNTEESCPLAPLPVSGLTHAETLSHQDNIEIRNQVMHHLDTFVSDALMMILTTKQLCLISCLLTNSVFITVKHHASAMRWHRTLSPLLSVYYAQHLCHLTCGSCDGQSQSQRTARPHIACHQPGHIRLRPEVSSPGPEARCVFVCFQSIRVFTPMSESRPCQHSSALSV